MNISSLDFSMLIVATSHLIRWPFIAALLFATNIAAEAAPL